MKKLLKKCCREAVAEILRKIRLRKKKSYSPYKNSLENLAVDCYNQAIEDLEELKEKLK